ncbi:MAG: hypothetical protein P1V51_16385 [Deltaproteobacteria bacterium]|nr:hypothetical protein [Deltaproteobacteria bacterium]
MRRRWASRILPAALLLGIALLPACDDTPSPEASLRAFIAAAAAGDHDRAWEGLTPETRQAADVMVAAVREALLAAGETPPRDGKALIFGQGLEMIREVESIEELSREGGVARLRVKDPGGETVELEMRLQEGRWRLHLPLED